LGANHAFHEESDLANSIRVAFARQTKDRYFFRAETQGHLASLLEHPVVDSDYPIDQKPVPISPYSDSFVATCVS
jgi:predicted ATPase